MAKLLWGRVYYKDIYAGILREEPGGRMAFIYEPSYIEHSNPAIAHSLPLQVEPHISQNGLHPFFDNLVAEGWLEHAQSRLLNTREPNRFELLLAFGFDCHGAVYVLDPQESPLSQAMMDLGDAKEVALLQSRASLSGVQPKLAVIHKEGKFYPTTAKELSTHIAKFPSRHHDDLVLNEYVITQAFKALVPNDYVVELAVDYVQGIEQPALVVKRFDRDNGVRHHFEEFNQLLRLNSSQKYNGSHHAMADFIKSEEKCMPIDNFRLFSRIVAGFLLGNTDMHFKNFAMMYGDSGYTLTPSYDQVAAYLYNFKTIALQTAGTKDMLLGQLKAKHVVALSQEFDLNQKTLNMIINNLEKNLEHALSIVADSDLLSQQFKNSCIKMIESRWNGTFALIGKALSKRQ